MLLLEKTLLSSITDTKLWFFFSFLVRICDKCDKKAKCLNKECVCNDGYVGNGLKCKSKYEMNTDFCDCVDRAED